MGFHLFLRVRVLHYQMCVICIWCFCTQTYGGGDRVYSVSHWLAMEYLTAEDSRQSVDVKAVWHEDWDAEMAKGGWCQLRVCHRWHKRKRPTVLGNLIPQLTVLIQNPVAVNVDGVDRFVFLFAVANNRWWFSNERLFTVVNSNLGLASVHRLAPASFTLPASQLFFPKGIC